MRTADDKKRVPVRCCTAAVCMKIACCVHKEKKSITKEDVISMRITSSTTETSAFGVVKTAAVAEPLQSEAEKTAADNGDTVEFSQQALRLSGSTLRTEDDETESGGSGSASSGTSGTAKLDAMIEQVKKQIEALQKQLKQMEQQQAGGTEAEQQAQEQQKQALQSQIANLLSQLMSLNSQKMQEQSGSGAGGGYSASAT